MTSSAQKLCTRSFTSWASMTKQLHAIITSSSTILSIHWSGAKHGTTGLLSCENLFCGVKNHTSLSGSLMGEYGFDECQEKTA